MSEDTFEELFAAADPVRPVGRELANAVEALGLEIRRSSDTVPSRRRRRGGQVLAAVGIVAGCGVGFGVAAATTDLFDRDSVARTGRYGLGGEQDTSELIRVDAPDAPVVVAELGETIPLPPGGNWDEVIADLPSEPTDMTELGLRSTLEFNAGCQWATYWIAAHDAGDEEAMDDAQQVLDAIPTWPATVATNSNGGIVRMWQRIADAARDQNRAALYDAGYFANCTGIEPGR